MSKMEEEKKTQRMLGMKESHEEIYISVQKNMIWNHYYPDEIKKIHKK